MLGRLVEKEVWELSVGEDLEYVVSVEVEDKGGLLDLGGQEEGCDDKEVVRAHGPLATAVEHLEELCDLPVAQVCDTLEDHHEHVLLKVAPAAAYLLDGLLEVAVPLFCVYVVQ